ncbi:2-oxo acid dehydrogenase subunit E2 [Clostridium botulinum]|nr:2-oxo acid dehydrogenase subunit E2 [Clostridium botulinum]NFL48911.1 2-oxo acid dehydrogenase subunit E2 [Clostridium botulinum]NFM42384.1 2-oxo acid dehydrogenase subunit E2 [Clostridium botulinum]NFM57006.1 2-oxo acid dehydrogenase subunit E2 [Clostridium botulinum]NFP25721.1 2-oxo acid dehydrogenase subunit E2 [Clostridium botulinum]
MNFVFTNEGDKIRNKQLKKYINISVAIDMEYGDTKK